jgi:hypothetical protein
MGSSPRSLPDILDRLPWFEDLTEEHQVELMNVTADHIAVGSPLSEFVDVLLHWSEVAHDDAKWARLDMLRETGILSRDAEL